MTGIALLGALTAAVLLYSGFKGFDPRSLFTSVFTGQPPTSLGDGSSASGNATIPTSAAAADTGTCVDAKNLATYSNGTPGGVRLLPQALDAFKRAEEMYRHKILLTGSYRSCAVQIASHARDPERFADPAESYHPKGLAIDVSMAVYNARIVSALIGSGWCQPRAADEPWHFSYGGCG